MDPTLTFAHLSDPHLTSPAGVSIADLLGKRALGYLSWRLRRRRRHRAEVLASLREDLARQRQDHVVVTGDLTNLGLPAELDEARRWLEALGPPARITVVPGNHDAYARATAGAMIARWLPYLAGDGGPDGASSFPSVRIRGPVAFIGVSSARPSAPFFAVGAVGAEQRRRLAQALAEGGRRGRFRVVLIHHPLLPGAVRWHRQLADGGALREVLARAGAELVLHGHTHRTSLGYLDAAAGPIPIIGVPSASAVGSDPHRGARYHVYRLTRRDGGWELTLSVRAYAGVHEGFVDEAAPRPVLPVR